ncbi:MAG: hypothetical protein ABI465_16830 [Ktedonobacteraceae bacterium]
MPTKPYNARRAPSNIMPELPYEQAMTRYLITPDALIFKMRTCPTGDFTRWVRAVVWACPAVQEALRDMDYASTVDRWYAINMLLEHDISVPLYPTFDQAQAVLDKGK